MTAMVGRAELLAAVGSLGCLYLACTRRQARWRYPVALVALALGVLSKENAAVTPLLAAGWTLRVGNRRVWTLSHIMRAVGVALPVFSPTIGSIMIAALLIGGTFMINALASMQEAQSVAGLGGATGLMAAMIAAFATGQVVGPLLLNYLIGLDADFSQALLIAAAALIASAYALSRSHK